ncbi:LRRC40 [Bugula neritina]|uniref:LRRC40 n=1 Tax=Bugula neritina TaxID=10212 RepID=A0A7J7JGE9_BUGNE|nr:LRRC40 [Bugula neritina]
MCQSFLIFVEVILIGVTLDSESVQGDTTEIMSSARRGRFHGKPFGGNASQQSTSGVSDQLIKNGRKSGQLNLSSRGLNAAAESRGDADFDNDERWWDQVELTKLILASNKIQDLSEDVKLLSALQSLDIHDNELQGLPETLGELHQLQKLNVSHNKLSSLPSALFSCPQLVYLHLEHNNLSELPNELGNLVELDDLDVSNNKLCTLPATIGQLVKLKSINLSNNNLTVLPSQIQFLKGIRTLDLTHNQLTSLPKELGYMRSLEQLYVRHNKLKELPLLEHCSNLKELHLGNNLLTCFGSDQLQCLNSLTVLDVRDNKIAIVPVEITQLTTLERLDISNNDVSALPYELGNMVHLKSLVVDGNPMRSIRRDIIARGSEGIKKYLRSRIEMPEEPKKAAAVSSSGSGQTGLFGGGEQVDAHSVKVSRALDYSGKKAEEVPPEIWELGVSTQVTDLNLSKNQIKQWPSSLVLLSDWVVTVNLGFNKLTALHTDLGLCLRLQNLDLRNNCLSTLPKEMESLQNLHTLILSVNRFGEVPAVVYKLKSLETLLISGNQVAQIDVSSLRQLDKLSSLDLQNNNISVVPPELGLCTNLRSLLLSGNPCRNPRPAILNKGTDALLDYLRGRIVQ